MILLGVCGRRRIGARGRTAVGEVVGRVVVLDEVLPRGLVGEAGGIVACCGALLGRHAVLAAFRVIKAPAVENDGIGNGIPGNQLRNPPGFDLGLCRLYTSDAADE